MKTLSISEAKRSLGRVADRALRGEPVFIFRKARVLALQEYVLPAPIPQRPEGYFADCYTASEVVESNRLAARGPKRIVP